MGDKVYDPWLNTARDAHNGVLSLAPDAAGDAAAYAADCATSLSAAQGYTHLLTQYTGFSDNGTLQSALGLRDRFAAQGGQMGTILGHYLDLVNAMGDTFLTAGKLYKSKDEDAATAFDVLKRDAVTRASSTAIPKAGATQIPSWVDSTPDPNDGNGNGDMATVSQAKSGRYTDAIGSEDPSGHDAEWFLAVGQGINAQPIADMSALWNWIADRISTDFQHLSGRIQRMNDDGSWTGKGAAGAVAAAKSFEAQATDLSTDLHAIAENLLYTAGWLNLTKAAMPTSWDGDKLNGSAEETRVINVGIAAFKSFYIPGLTNSSTMIPKLVDPTAQPPALADTGGSHTSDYTGGGPTGGGPTGGSTGGGPQGLVSATAAPLLSPKSTSTPNGGGQNGSAPGGSKDPGGSNPSGSDPGGSNPGGSNPGGSNPGGTDSGDTNQDSSGSSADSSQSSSGLSQLQSAMQSGMQGLQSAEQANQQNLQSQLQNSPLGTLPNLLGDLKTPLGATGVGGGGGGGPKLDAVQPAKLFPRAAAIAGALEAESVGVARAGLATGPASAMGGGGMGGMGHGAGGHGNQGKEHKRLEALESSEYLDEAMGVAPIVAKPVVEG